MNHSLKKKSKNRGKGNREGNKEQKMRVSGSGEVMECIFL